MCFLSAEGKSIGPDAVELRVNQALLMMVTDGDGSVCSWTNGSVPALTKCRETNLIERSGKIMRIFDKEFDSDARGSKDLKSFREAWVKRGGNAAYADSVMAAIGL